MGGAKLDGAMEFLVEVMVLLTVFCGIFYLVRVLLWYCSWFLGCCIDVPVVAAFAVVSLVAGKVVLVDVCRGDVGGGLDRSAVIHSYGESVSFKSCTEAAVPDLSRQTVKTQAEDHSHCIL